MKFLPWRDDDYEFVLAYEPPITTASAGNVWLFVRLIYFEAHGDDFSHKYGVEVVGAAPLACRHAWKKACESTGVLFDEFTNAHPRAQAWALIEYGVSALFHQDVGNNKARLLAAAKQHVLMDDIFDGLDLQKRQNKIGATAFDNLSGRPVSTTLGYEAETVFGSPGKENVVRVSLHL